MFNAYPFINPRIPYKALLVILALCWTGAYGQERIITGHVTDSVTGLPLASCSVYTLNSGNGVITDEKGKYAITISDRTDSITISMIGYRATPMAVSKASEQVINFKATPYA